MYYIPSHFTNRQGTFLPRLTPGSDHAGTAGAEIGKSSELGSLEKHLDFFIFFVDIMGISEEYSGDMEYGMFSQFFGCGYKQY